MVNTSSAGDGSDPARPFIGIELNPQYVELGRNRIRDDAPLLNVPAEAAA